MKARLEQKARLKSEHKNDRNLFLWPPSTTQTMCEKRFDFLFLACKHVVTEKKGKLIVI